MTVSLKIHMTSSMIGALVHENETSKEHYLNLRPKFSTLKQPYGRYYQLNEFGHAYMSNEGESFIKHLFYSNQHSGATDLDNR